MDSKYHLIGGKKPAKVPTNRPTTVVNFSSSPKKPRLDHELPQVTQPAPGILHQQRKSLPVYSVRNRY
jgi:hypothetical protein